MADIKASGRQASEDDRKLTERQVEELTKEFVQRVDAALQAKESELDLWYLFDDKSGAHAWTDVKTS